MALLVPAPIIVDRQMECQTVTRFITAATEQYDFINDPSAKGGAWTIDTTGPMAPKHQQATQNQSRAGPFAF